jgi:putative membrane protein
VDAQTAQAAEPGRFPGGLVMPRIIRFALIAALSTAAMSFASHNASAASVTDPQIAQIVVTANSIDIANGKIALDRSKTPAVRDFANLMIKDHTAVNESATALVTKLGVKPEASATSKSLQDAANTEQQKLRTMPAAEFDRAYLENEVAYHKQVLGAISDVLIPNAQNAELKKMLVDVKPAFQAHLDHAEETLAGLGSGGH